MPDTDPAPAATTPTQESREPQPAVDPTVELEALKAKYERAQKDLQTFRLRADEVTAAQKEAEQKALAEADAVKKAELLQAKVTELEAKEAAALAKATAAERRAALTGKVIDPAAALKLLDDSQHLDDDGNIDTEKLLADYPFLAPNAPHASNPALGGGGTLKHGTANPWARDTLNLTRQAQILRENPTLAETLKQQAKEQ